MYVLCIMIRTSECIAEFLRPQGNHFNEYAGFECDYGRYPDAQRASHFLRHYLSEAEGCKPVRMPDMMGSAAADPEILSNPGCWS